MKKILVIALLVCLVFTGCKKHVKVNIETNNTAPTCDWENLQPVNEEFEVDGFKCNIRNVTPQFFPEVQEIYQYEKLELDEEYKKNFIKAVVGDATIYKFDTKDIPGKILEAEITYYEANPQGMTEAMIERANNLKGFVQTAPADFAIADSYEGDDYLVIIDDVPYEIQFGRDINNFTNYMFGVDVYFGEFFRPNKGTIADMMEMDFELISNPSAIIEDIDYFLDTIKLEGTVRETLKEVGDSINGTFNVIGGENYNRDEAYSQYAMLTMVYANNQMTRFELSNPLHIKSTSKATLLPWDTIMDRIRDTINEKGRYIYKNGFGIDEYDVCTLILSHYEEYDEELEEYTLIPVWNVDCCFYVNAVTGEVGFY